MMKGGEGFTMGRERPVGRGGLKKQSKKKKGSMAGHNNVRPNTFPGRKKKKAE